MRTLPERASVIVERQDNGLFRIYVQTDGEPVVSNVVMLMDDRDEALDAARIMASAVGWVLEDRT